MLTRSVSGLIPGCLYSPFLPFLPRLLNLSSLQEAIISCFFSPSSNWDFHFHRNLQDPKTVELASLVSPIQDIQLFPSRSDFRQWNPSSNGLFSVLLLRSFGSILPNPFPLKAIWLPLIPSKIQEFQWKISSKRAPTLDVVKCFLMPILYASLWRKPSSICFFTSHLLGDNGAKFSRQ